MERALAYVQQYPSPWDLEVVVNAPTTHPPSPLADEKAEAYKILVPRLAAVGRRI